MIDSVEISIILRTYNTNPTYLERAIKSVFNQDFQNFELVIVDDGSTYEYAANIIKYCTHTANRILYTYQPNKGESQAANRGVLNSSGNYITFIDSDDEYKPNHLSSCIAEMEEVDLICSTATLVGDRQQDFYVADRTDTTKLIHVDNTILFGTLFGKREIFDNIKFTTEYGADAVFFEQAGKSYSTKKTSLRTYIYYRNIPNSLSTLIKAKYETI